MMQLQQPRNPKKRIAPNRTKSKFNIQHLLKRKNSTKFGPGPHLFNDPLYQDLDNQVPNKQQHNFGPWIEHQRLKSRQRNINKINSFPILYRPQDNHHIRYYQDDDQINQENNIHYQPLPNIRDNNLRAFSLQHLAAASLQFNPVGNSIQINSIGNANHRRDGSNKIPFFLKMQGHLQGKGKIQLSDSKKSNFIYNYGLQEDALRSFSLKLKGLNPLKPSENYLKLQQKANLLRQTSNQLLFQQLKQHRLNKMK